MTFDPTKPVQTRDGRPARILCDDFRSPGYPIVAAVQTKNDPAGECVWLYRWNGHSLTPDRSNADLINVPEKRTMWVNIYTASFGAAYASREKADENDGSGRIACVPLTYTAGEGL